MSTTAALSQRYSTSTPGHASPQTIAANTIGRSSFAAIACRPIGRSSQVSCSHMVPQKAPHPQFPEASERTTTSGCTVATLRMRDTPFHRRWKVANWRGRSSGTRRDLESLAGTLQHAADVVSSGRLFLRRIYDLLAATLNPITLCALMQSAGLTSSGGLAAAPFDAACPPAVAVSWPRCRSLYPGPSVGSPDPQSCPGRPARPAHRT